jgi:hypothetical protein
MSPLTEPTRLTLAKGQPFPNDPYLYTNTVLLLHGDGTNGSTNIVDSSKVAGSPKTVTAAGNAQISTAQSKFGGASIAFDGTGDYLSVPVSSDLELGTGNFTIELWFYIAANSTPNAVGSRFAQLIGNVSNASFNGIELNISGNSTTTGIGFEFINTVGGTQYKVSYTGSVSQSTWHHVAVVRSGTTTLIYFNGTSVASGTLGNQTISLVNPIWIGGLNVGGYNHYLNGYIDDLRITKGVARYTTNFTPPTLAVPDF